MVEFLGKEFEIRSLPSDRLTGVNIERNRSKPYGSSFSTRLG